ncbi:MAG: ParB N-terminal domain-containing protein [Sedimentisphaerales bacterium]|nr:ParB N-terminal domain-containing protein [Sedimentisphaerales bacterium]
MTTQQPSLFGSAVDHIVEGLDPIIQEIEALPFADQVEALNRIRARLHEVSPFRDEPVDLVLWVPRDRVRPNHWNPNVVYKPEMALLIHSVDVDHYTQPVVTHHNDDGWVVTDGEHRYKVGNMPRFARRLHDYLPVTVTDTRTEEEHMASCIRHNRARGAHKLTGMSLIVDAMIQAGWTDDRIAEALGMDADEILRMRQVGGVAATYNRPYNRAWIVDDGREDIDTPADPESGEEEEDGPGDVD